MNKPKRPVFSGTAGGVNINSVTPGYGVGFGMGDFNRVKSDNYDAQSVLDYLSNWNNPVGPKARTALTQYAAQQRADDFTPPPPPPAPIVNIPPPAPTVPAPMSIKGNAAGVKRKKSRGEMSGATSQGTNQFNRSMFIGPAPLTNLNV